MATFVMDSDMAAQLKALGEYLPQSHFLNRIQNDIAKGFIGLAGGLKKLNNLDTSKMSPLEREITSRLIIKINQNSATNDSKINPVKKIAKENIIDDMIEE